MKRARSSGRQSGFTLIEVVAAVTVLMIGSVGFFGMQGAVTRGTQDAYESSMAINFAHVWLERVKRDALGWRAVGQPTNATTTYISFLPHDQWFAPTPVLASESRGANYVGFDVQARADMRYCVNLRILPFHTYNAKTKRNLASEINALRVDIRVWWHRSSVREVFTNRLLGDMNATGCGTVPDDALLNADRRLRTMYVSTIVKWRLLP